MVGKTLPPRVVVVTRPTDYERLLLTHGTREQARYYLETRGRKIDEALERHEVHERALHLVLAAIPTAWRRTRVTRADLDRFLFEPEDVVVAVGQDGLVANVAKYTHGQLVLGVNPSRAFFDGLLVQHPPEMVKDILPMCAAGRAGIEERSMVQATTSDGASLEALNEIYVGHQTHQSARYVIGFGDETERQSSSGLIVTTGTGATGWAKSVVRQRKDAPALPSPTDRELVFMVREAWPSVRTGTDLSAGLLAPGCALVVTSEMNDGGVAFGDGIEEDHLELPYGQVVTIARSERCLRLVV
jgi:NAD kinase